jgi:hypothetical protein
MTSDFHAALHRWLRPLEPSADKKSESHENASASVPASTPDLSLAFQLTGPTPAVIVFCRELLGRSLGHARAGHTLVALSKSGNATQTELAAFLDTWLLIDSWLAPLRPAITSYMELQTKGLSLRRTIEEVGDRTLDSCECLLRALDEVGKS